MIDALLQMLIGFVRVWVIFIQRGEICSRILFYIVDKLKDIQYPPSFEKECALN